MVAFRSRLLKFDPPPVQNGSNLVLGLLLRLHAHEAVAEVSCRRAVRQGSDEVLHVGIELLHGVGAPGLTALKFGRTTACSILRSIWEPGATGVVTILVVDSPVSQWVKQVAYTDRTRSAMSEGVGMGEIRTYFLNRTPQPSHTTFGLIMKSSQVNGGSSHAQTKSSAVEPSRLIARLPQFGQLVRRDSGDRTSLTWYPDLVRASGARARIAIPLGPKPDGANW